MSHSNWNSHYYDSWTQFLVWATSSIGNFYSKRSTRLPMNIWPFHIAYKEVFLQSYCMPLVLPILQRSLLYKAESKLKQISVHPVLYCLLSLNHHEGRLFSWIEFIVFYRLCLVEVLDELNLSLMPPTLILYCSWSSSPQSLPWLWPLNIPTRLTQLTPHLTHRPTPSLTTM